jgi:sugar (pentulose or hexulose) kinase
VLGTTCLNCVVSERALFEPADLGLLFCLPGGGWLRTMVNVAGTSNLDWAVARFGLPDIAAAEAQAAASLPGARGLLYLPYLSGAGIIAPLAEPGARATFFGLDDGHGTADLLRAVYEGVALSIRDCLAAIPLPVEELRLIGGGARSRLWPQLIADCIARPVVTLGGEEFGARGAAVLAGCAVGVFADPRTAAASHAPAVTARYLPEPAAVAQYDAIHARYVVLRDALRPLWRAAG